MEEIREYWESGIRKMVRYFWTRVLLEPGVQKQEKLLTVCNFSDKNAEMEIPEEFKGAECLITNLDRTVFEGRIVLKPYEAFVLYKIKERMKNTDEYQEEIDAEIHYSNQPIKIPRQIRNYFRGIDKYKKQDSEKYKYFRNACIKM